MSPLRFSKFQEDFRFIMIRTVGKRQKIALGIVLPENSEISELLPSPIYPLPETHLGAHLGLSD